MRFLAVLFFLFLLPRDAWCYVPHEYPAIYTQQLGRIFLFISFLVVIWSILRNRLHRQKGWRFLFLSLIFFSIWNLDVFVGRAAELIANPQTIGGTEGWEYFARQIRIEYLEYLYYLGRLDFALLNIAMFFFYLGLSEHLREEGRPAQTGFAVVLPLLPIFITDMAGNSVFILLSVMSLHASVNLYRKDKENVLWNYMVWLASSWVMFSISRSFGHIVRHVLIPTGHQDIWKFFEPVTGSFNTFALFFVGSVSLFFVRIYESHMRISEDKRKLEALVSERTVFIEQLEKDKADLKELDKMKSAFLANMSHELRTPMNSIIGYTELLQDKVDGPLNEEQERSLQKVRDGAKRLQGLIDDILHMSRIESAGAILEIRAIDPKRLIESVVAGFEHPIRQKGLTLTLDMKKDLPKVYGDEDKIRRILINLLSNAVKFTHQGGVWITAGPSERGTEVGGDPLFLEICVRDTGIGIKEEDLEKIFGKFFQVDFALARRYEGAGIGLSVARGLAKMHNGELWATSRPGEGSRFCFTLPMRKEMLKNTGIEEGRLHDGGPSY